MPTQKSSTKPLPQVMRVFVSTPTAVDSDKVNENGVGADSAIVNENFPLVTPGFVRAHNPF
jgi:hypothetical protein